MTELTYNDAKLENDLEEALLALESSKISRRRSMLDEQKQQAEILRIREQRATIDRQIADHEENISKLRAAIAKRKEPTVQA